MHAQRNNKELHIIFCDIAKAFDKVPQAALTKALQLHGFPEKIIQRVEALQKCEAAFTRTPYGHSEQTCPITMGCKQGCPMSPIRFCLFIDMFYRWLAHTHPEIAYTPDHDNNNSLFAQAWMDDTALVANNTAGSTTQIALLHDFLTAHDMTLNISKCSHLQWLPTEASNKRSRTAGNQDSKQSENLIIPATASRPLLEITTLKDGDQVTYLGINIGPTLNWEATWNHLQ
jgi:hypothetical protein